MFRLPESSVLIPYLRNRTYGPRIEADIDDGRMLLSSVVCEEILAGARDGYERRRYDTFFSRFRRDGLLVTPTDDEWHTCGHLISRYGGRFGRVLARDHQNDVLILLSAPRWAQEEETTLLTENDADFRTWLRLLPRQSGLRIAAMRRG